MIRKNYSLLIVLGLVILFLYYASYYSNSSNNKKQLNFIRYSSDVTGKNGMVVSASKIASEVGINILKKGGNAVDAAVAVEFALAVTYPQAGNIGGGGFMLIKTHALLGKDTIISIDFREKAPLAASSDMYLDKNGNVIPDKSITGHLSCGVPGSVAGLLYALENYGTMKREEVLDPAIDLAENGFNIEERFAESLNSNYKEFSKFPSTKKIFTKNGVKFNVNDLFVQKDLANTLKLIKTQGVEGFYKGTTADLIENEMKHGGGIITKEDLLSYVPLERKVLTGNYKGYDIYSMGPSSSGGVALITLLNMIENDNLPDTNMGLMKAVFDNVLIESMKRVYADRSEYLGDPDFNDIRVQDLLTKQYAKERRKEIKDTATAADKIYPGLNKFYKESNQTTHFSVIDKDGNMVSCTTTLNNIYGSYVVVDGAGFLMNDEMDDFSSKPGEPNMFGLTGSEANSIQPGKRMLSSMTPTIILKDKKPFMILGSPGGGKIITAVFETIMNVIDYKYSLSAAIDKPRFHHQWLPDYIQYEEGAFSQDEIDGLQRLGQNLKQVSDYGNVCGILIDWDNHTYYGHADRRGYGAAMTY